MDTSRLKKHCLYLFLIGIVVLRIIDVFTLNTKYGRVFYRYGLHKERNSMMHRAKFFYEKAIQYNPNISEPYYRLALIYKERGDLKKYYQNIQMATYFNEYSTESFFELGLALQSLGQFKRAIAAFDQAVFNSPQDPVYYYYLGVTFLSDHQFNNAVEMAVKIQRMGDSELANKLEDLILTKTALN